MKTDHKQVHIKYKDHEADVDEGLADLILNLWKLDIYTSMSCENNNDDNIVWLNFPHAIESEKFMNVAVKYDTDMYHRAMGYTDEDDWTIDTNLENYGVDLIFDEKDEDIVDEKFNGTNDFYLSVSIRFSISDLKEVEKNVLEAIKELKNKN